MAALRSGRVVQMLADQRPHQGVRAPFFGIETTTNIVPARAARETGAPIVLMSMRRLGPARFSITFQPPRSFTPDDDEAAIAGWINAFFEAELRATPGQWLWGHPRWGDALSQLHSARPTTKIQRRSPASSPCGRFRSCSLRSPHSERS